MKEHVRTISHRLSLRKPQEESLRILSRVADLISLEKNPDLMDCLKKLRLEYPSVEDFEREFPNLCFALATGVGKTRLMGAFIAYLYLEKGIKNFFILAPNNTIHDKLIDDFSKPNSPKYVFRGISEIAQNPIKIITRDNFQSGEGVRNRRAKQGDLFDSTQIHINIFNISKINSESRGNHTPLIKRLSEYIGESYFEYLSNLDDLVLIMDEAHRYRATAAMRVINELNPVIGIELTATPHLESGKKTVPFQNTIYHYPLALALKDGFVKEPAVATRENFNSQKYTEGELEILKIQDGIRIHENTKLHLQTYADETGTQPVKPFILIIAQDTAHANSLRKLIENDDFYNGQYKGKVTSVHSAKSGDAEEQMIRELLSVESMESPIEIVIHVNMLKEGWDVRNLYTIIPLRAANSKTLIEQSVGRGLRLPFGKRTGVQEVDRLTIVSHDRFKEIVDEAKKPDSIIRRGIVIGVDIPLEGEEKKEVRAKYVDEIEKELPKQEHEILKRTVQAIRQRDTFHEDLENQVLQDELIAGIGESLREDGYETNRNRLQEIVKKTIGERARLTIEIPKISTIKKEKQPGYYQMFQLNFDRFCPQPVEQTILIQYLESGKREKVCGSSSSSLIESFDDYIVSGLLDFDDVGEHHLDLLYELSQQLLEHLRSYLASKEDIANVLQYHRKSLLSRLHAQMQDHYVPPEFEFETTQSRGSFHFRNAHYTYPKQIQTIYHYMDPIDQKHEISRFLFQGFDKCIYPMQKFHSDSEKLFVRILETDQDVLKWVKPPRAQLQIFYHQDSAYEPDFVVETSTHKYLCEIKRKSEMEDPIVCQKAEAAKKWCINAIKHSEKYGGKPWAYLLIPHDVVKSNMTLKFLAQSYTYGEL